ncbi:putative pre-mRNA-splicing factor ATP-dependent RNA helicase DHX32 [Corythoichthys intestinalis]|uniref:putative pre-mRNA-splicing factor ATP-dependent RNA helicase DHX32 n=1 Tax=Corythoichthys intestinalis TaxID=161448 RepID=UPI0025A57808|nr:putative pre-mRNA-splicing factor ATP-dependent RNA helicase DHX32 [Corythoichthys intestinalis]
MIVQFPTDLVIRSKAASQMALETTSADESFERLDKEEYNNILELKQFDGLPYSSIFYNLLKESKALLIWNIKSDFMNALAKEQVLIVAASVATGRSSQVAREVDGSGDFLILINKQIDPSAFHLP